MLILKNCRKLGNFCWSFFRFGLWWQQSSARCSAWKCQHELQQKGLPISVRFYHNVSSSSAPVRPRVWLYRYCAGILNRSSSFPGDSECTSSLFGYTQWLVVLAREYMRFQVLYKNIISKYSHFQTLVSLMIFLVKKALLTFLVSVLWISQRSVKPYSGIILYCYHHKLPFTNLQLAVKQQMQ